MVKVDNEGGGKVEAVMPVEVVEEDVEIVTDEFDGVKGEAMDEGGVRRGSVARLGEKGARFVERRRRTVTVTATTDSDSDSSGGQ
ncbi:hypothetical protein Droror1_Dr00018412 [Drosera rotundifolia]